MMANSRRRAGAAALAATVAGWTMALVPGAGPAAAAPGTAGEVEPIHLVIVVDESGSLSPEDVVQERIAAASIAMSELSPQSDVTVYGFGSSTGGVDAIDSSRICTLKPGAAAQDREAVGTCVERNITVRDKGKGDNTDFVAALNQGIDVLTRASDDRPRMLLLLTDGQLDVRGDTAYGPDEAAQQRYAKEQIEKLVAPKASREKVQIWPIGFGGAIDMAMLNFLAGNGGRASCSAKEVVPAARKAGNATAAVAAMMDAFVRARCLDSNTTPQVPIADGKKLDLEVTVPAIATDGAINVVKGDPRVKVSYHGPDDKPVPAIGTVGESAFELAGTSGVVESMRIRNPAPGTWRIHLEAPPDLAEQMVSATALWQGVLRTVFVLDPPSPAPGEKFTVIMRPHTRSAALDPASLRGLAFSAGLTGGGAVEQDAALADDGKAPDDRGGDAYYSASFALPADASGTYKVVGTATGPGVTSDRQEKTFKVGGGGQQVRTRIELARADGYAGDEIGGTVRATNDGTGPRRVRVVLADLPDPEAVTVRNPDVVLEPGQGTPTFTLDIADDAGAGPVGGVIQIVDAAGGEVLGNTPLDLTVLERPSVLERWWLPALLLLIALTLVVLLVEALRRRRRATADLKDVVVTLWEDGQPTRPTLKAPGGPVFEFDLRVPDDGSPPSLMRVNPRAGRYRIERLQGGQIRLDLPRTERTPDTPALLKLQTGQTTALPNHPRLALSADGAGRKVPKQTKSSTGPKQTKPASPRPAEADVDL